MENFNEITRYVPNQEFNDSLIPDFTEQEIKDILLRAKEERRAELYKKWYWNKVNYIPEIQRVSSLEMFELVKARAKMIEPNFVIDEDNQEVVMKLCKYFSGEYGGGLDPNKGILLRGPVGCGKSVLIKAFQYNQQRSYAIRHIKTIVDEYGMKETGGAPALQKYYGFMKPNTQNPYLQSEFDLFIDDVGTEEVGKHYGTTVNVFETLILMRYEGRHIGAKLHVVANITTDQMIERYGSRAASRMREMFNYIDFDVAAKDRRK